MDHHCPTCTHCGLPVPLSRRGGDPITAFCCYGCRIAHVLGQAAADDTTPTPAPNTLLLRLGLGIFLAMNIMAFSSYFYAQEIYQPHTHAESSQPYTTIAGLFSYLLLLLCTAAIAALGMPLFMDAIDRFSRTGAPWRLIDANSLILIGVLAAYGLSAANTLRGRGELYFDTAAMILVLVTLGHYLDSTARRRATRSAQTLLDHTPTRVWLRRANQVVETDAPSLVVGDEVRARTGEAIPADGVVIEGHGDVDESTLTGESQPRPVGPGDAVLAGSVVLDGQVWVTARSVGPDRVIAHMKQLLELARQRQPAIQRVADRVAGLFVPGVIVVAISVLSWHAYQENWPRGLFDSLSVLLISCPCALGLAAPLATWSGLACAQRHGVLIDSGATLERAAAVSTVFFDKTGTLTTGQMTVTEIRPRGYMTQDEALSLAAAVEAGSVHPAARALVACATHRGLQPPKAHSVRNLPGLGVEAAVNGMTYRVGNARLLNGSPGDTGATGPRVYLVANQQELARFQLSEETRREASGVVDHLKTMGLGVQVITGDQPGPARALQEHLRVPVHARLLPIEKVAHLERVRLSRPGAVAMVGDGVNDGPVLAAADVGIAVVGATSLAQRAGNVWLMSPRLDRLPLFLAIARHTLRRIRLNLLWAFGYNTVGIVLAAAGYLNPVFAASAMFASSVLIVTTSAGAGRVEHEPVE